jgi:hypothetical protein
MNISKVCLMVLFLGSLTAGIALGQQRSQSIVNEPVETLSGRLVYHDGIRNWFELILDEAQAGQGSIQLIPAGVDSRPMEALRGCRVRSIGTVFSSPIGDPYYSLNTTQSVQHIEPVETCTSKPPIPSSGNGTAPDENVHNYQVEMRVNSSPGDHPVVFRVTSAGKELQPWQAWARYELTRGFALDGLCDGGFVVEQVFGTLQARPSHLIVPQDSQDLAVFDLRGAALSGKTDLQLGYTCVRIGPKNQKSYRIESGQLVGEK